jgi:hypothetical protein
VEGRCASAVCPAQGGKEGRLFVAGGLWTSVLRGGAGPPRRCRRNTFSAQCLLPRSDQDRPPCRSSMPFSRPTPRRTEGREAQASSSSPPAPRRLTELGQPREGVHTSLNRCWVTTSPPGPGGRRVGTAGGRVNMTGLTFPEARNDYRSLVR